MGLARALWPRLTYRLWSGHWCTHATYRFGSWVDEVDVAAGNAEYSEDMVNPGFGPWEMYDMGRAKHRCCARCGYRETTWPTPVMDWLQRRGLVH
jgi:hypothetical protein